MNDPGPAGRPELEFPRHPRSDNSKEIWGKLRAEAMALVYITIIAALAVNTGARYLLFPELAALSFDVFTRPRGVWASAPMHLALAPALAGVIGSVITNFLPYGIWSVSLDVSLVIAMIMIFRSPVAPAISAGLLPLVIGVKSWWYAPGILFGTGGLALLSLLWNSIYTDIPNLSRQSAENHVDDEMESISSGYQWLWALAGFVFAAMIAVVLTGLRFILFPPLVVIGFEMFGHTAICPWAKRPMMLPVACFLTALGGLIFLRLLGMTAVAAALSTVSGIAVLRVCDLHIPPALAVALLPMVMDSPTIAYPASVLAGTSMMSLWFLAYQRLSAERSV